MMGGTGPWTLYGPRVQVGVEYKKETCWVGVFWRFSRGAPIQPYCWLDVWVCLAPCWPVHVALTWRMGRPARVQGARGKGKDVGPHA